MGDFFFNFDNTELKKNICFCFRTASLGGSGLVFLLLLSSYKIFFSAARKLFSLQKKALKLFTIKICLGIRNYICIHSEVPC